MEVRRITSGTTRWMRTTGLRNSGELPKATMRQYLFGGVLGGPPQRDRLFFLGSYEALSLDKPVDRVVAMPTPGLRPHAPASLQPFLNALPLPAGACLHLAPTWIFTAHHGMPASLNQVTPSFTRSMASTYSPGSEAAVTATKVRQMSPGPTGRGRSLLAAPGDSDRIRQWCRSHGDASP